MGQRKNFSKRTDSGSNHVSDPGINHQNGTTAASGSLPFTNHLPTSPIGTGSDFGVIMPNLLDFPPKRTYEISLENAVRDFISFHGGGHPDEFKNDIKQWLDLRKNAVSGAAHIDQINAILLWVSEFPVPFFIPTGRPLSLCTVTTLTCYLFWPKCPLT